MHLIGINGFKRSGKGTVADFITDHYVGGEGVVYQVGFADKVKIMAARSLGFFEETPRECIALMDVAKEYWLLNASTIGCEIQEITGRQYLQNVGVEARKLFGDDFWVDQVLPRPSRRRPRRGDERDATNQVLLQCRFEGVDCVAITDLRFENEAERVLALGGVVWRVNRPECESDGHDSEQPLPDHLISLEIWNDGTLGQLETRVQDALETPS
jgi:hypothetical protein